MASVVVPWSEEVVDDAQSLLKKNHPRDDYKDLIQVTVIFLRGLQKVSSVRPSWPMENSTEHDGCLQPSIPFTPSMGRGVLLSHGSVQHCGVHSISEMLRLINKMDSTCLRDYQFAQISFKTYKWDHHPVFSTWVRVYRSLSTSRSTLPRPGIQHCAQSCFVFFTCASTPCMIYGIEVNKNLKISPQTAFRLIII